MTVRHQDALAYLRALRQCIYADPLYIFPGRSMNYYGTKRREHDRDTLFASGLPFVLSINDVPEAWELYSRAEAAGAASEQSCCQRRNGYAGLSGAILCSAQN